MAEASKTTDTNSTAGKDADRKPTGVPVKADAPAALGYGDGRPAAESSDPAIHKILADIQTAQLNGDEDAEKELRAELKRLGYK